MLRNKYTERSKENRGEKKRRGEKRRVEWRREEKRREEKKEGGFVVLKMYCEVVLRYCQITGYRFRFFELGVCI